MVIWEADGSVDGRVGYGHAIAGRLVDAGLGVTTVPLTERMPTDLELQAPAHVVSGGNTSVHADVEWLTAARSRLGPVLDRALDGRAALTGICFGSQLIATLLAGPDAIGPHPQGMQAGLTEIDGLDGAGGTVGSSFHYHHIRRRLIEDAGGRVLAASAHTEVEAYEFGPGVRGVQFHPELCPRRLAVTLRRHHAIVAAHPGTPSRAARTIAARRRRWTDMPWTRLVAEPSIAVRPPTTITA